MEDTVRVQMTMDVPLNAALLAQAFCSMNDEQQAQFFIESARLAAAWPGDASYQWSLVGAHLRTCECSTPEAQDMIRSIVDGMVAS